eukprot:TRINITY_DN21056_c0_g1_i1.p1 TRINITY_DN21056_c0_g1~~TRINITY_DN21056_c0_g1_i1.p1  ORF type:complete len:170 (-),score=22.22 TRINITY_DN21056_c0_g1_i1:200-664(-)
MPRARSESRSYSRNPPPRKSRREDRSRSRGGRDRDRGGGGGGGRGGGGSDGGRLTEWGTSGVIVELKSGGFGFIRPDTGKVDDRDLFFHNSAVERGTVFDDLQVDDEVTYEACMDDRKGQATAKKVCLRGGGVSKKSRRKDDSRSPSPRDRRRR